MLPFQHQYRLLKESVVSGSWSSFVLRSVVAFSESFYKGQSAVYSSVYFVSTSGYAESVWICCKPCNFFFFFFSKKKRFFLKTASAESFTQYFMGCDRGDQRTITSLVAMLPSPPPPEQQCHLLLSLAAELASQPHGWHWLWWLNSRLWLLGAGSLSIQEQAEAIKQFRCWSYSSGFWTDHVEVYFITALLDVSSLP